MNDCRIPLEPAALTVCENSSKPPLIFQLPPAAGRKVLNQAQDSPVYKAPAAVSVTSVDTGVWGTIPLYIVKPDNLVGKPGVIFYLHGAGWVFGNFHTHEKLVRELAARTNSVLFFPEYSLSPEAKYPTAIEQCYKILTMIPQLVSGWRWNLNLDTLTVAGDSVGGNMATVMTLMVKHRGGLKIHKQLLYNPVTNDNFSTCSYCQFATGYYLYRAGMMWFWDQYTSCQRERNQITASPLKASPEQLRDLPPACIINGEADVLREEGEAYASRLLLAGVDVTHIRVKAIIHDFVMLNALDQTNGCRLAMDASTAWINRKNRRS